MDFSMSRRGFGRVLFAGLVLVTFAIWSVQGSNTSRPSADLTRSEDGSGSSVASSISRVQSADELSAAAEIIVYGNVRSDFQIVPLNEYGADYVMTLEVIRVFKGQSDTEVKVLRGGLLPGNDADRDPDELAGLIAPGPTVLFLKPSPQAGVYVVIGHTQGELPVRDGRVTQGRGASAIRDFNGMPLEQFEKQLRNR